MKMKANATILSTALLLSSVVAHAEINTVNLTKKNPLSAAMKPAAFEGEASAPDLAPIQGDPDGGDGAADGCVKINSTGKGGFFGATLTLGTADSADKTIEISTHVFNVNTSYVKYSVQVYNVTDKRVLASSPMEVLDKKKVTEKTVKLQYKTTAEDKGDTLELRWVQHSTDSTARDLYVDNVKVTAK
ncbi:MAG: hypothetical protein QNL01_13605 [Akkermansiaceae bacterium]